MGKTDFSDYWWGENHLCPEHKGFESIIKISPPQCFIRFKIGESQVSFEEFYKSIAEVSWFGSEPSKDVQSDIILNAWNYLALEEQILDSEYGKSIVAINSTQEGE